MLSAGHVADTNAVTADITYPDMRRDSFGPLLDSYRCLEVSDGRRCQLYDNHDGPHAHAIRPAPLRHRNQRYVPGVWHRWDQTGAWVQQPGTERLRWCCQGRA